MNDYTGKICPFCKTEFKPNDDIVVCSECDMPHHKDCWIENQGCTTFGCLGTIKAADNSATTVTTSYMNYEEANSPSSTGIVYCTKCGAQNSATSAFCSKCGNKLAATVEDTPQAPVYTQANPTNNNPYAYVSQQNNYQQANSYSTSGYSAYQPYQNTNIDSDVLQLIGVKTEYYAPKFQEMKNQNKQTSWNWPAFLVTPYWLIYRKMYGYGAAVLAVAFVLSLIGSGLLSFLALGGYVAFGIFANSIYMKYLEGKASQAKSMSEPYRTQFITKNAGVNTTATVLTIIGYALLIIILSV